jgi:hypothetical protein
VRVDVVTGGLHASAAVIDDPRIPGMGVLLFEPVEIGERGVDFGESFV